MDADSRKAVVESLSAKLVELYVYPDIGAQMAERILAHQRAGEYDALNNLEQLVTELNRDMLAVSADGHLQVSVLRDRGPVPSKNEDQWTTHAANARLDNFGFSRVELFPGNVGLLELTRFEYPELAAETLTAAMRFLAHGDALIIDLRQNSGGRTELAQILLSYFFADHRVHYLTERDGVRDITKQWWTLPFVAGERKPNLPLYLLISANTGSAAEEFTFALKNQGRATILGQTSAGAAHTTHLHEIPELGIEIHMPDGRSYDPITGEDWEGVGIVPHHPLDPDEALMAAHILAIDNLLTGEISETQRFHLDWARRDLIATQDPVVLDAGKLDGYVGSYGPRTISRDGDVLYYRREGRPNHELVPLGEHWFKLKRLDNFRIRFDVDEAGAVTALVGVNDDGSESASARTGK